MKSSLDGSTISNLVCVEMDNLGGFRGIRTFGDDRICRVTILRPIFVCE